MSASADIAQTDTVCLTPIDEIESFLMTTNWTFERLSSHEILVNLKGQYCEYQITATWQDHSKILHLAFAFSVGLSKEAMSSSREHSLLKLLSLINESQQIGHFDLWRDENAIIWRYGHLLPDDKLLNDTISYLFRLAFDTCERNYPAFQFLLWAGHSPSEALQFVLFETVGEA